MERKLDEKMDNLMSKPGVVGAMCVDKRGLCLSDRRSPSPLVDLDSSSSSDEAEMAGSPKKVRANRTTPDQILSGSVRSASYNIVFQVLTRVFTFALNAFILRYVSHEVLGVCNVRLALLYSSVMFLSREPFRRASLRKKETDSWSDTINLIWLVVPSTAFWSILGGYLWCYVLSQPGGNPESAIAIQYRSSVWVMVLALIIDSLSEVPYIIGQYFLFAKLRIVGDTTLIAVRSLFLAFAVIFRPSGAIMAYAVGTLFAVILVSIVYYGFFYYYISVVAKRDVPFLSLKQFLPKYKAGETEIPWELASLALSFFKQGFMKQILTEGERYMMTFFDILTFNEQGVYDLVSNLGSLAARFIFLPIEESAYFYFAQTLQRRESFSRRDKKLAESTAEVLGNLVKMMMIIGAIMIVYGIPYSNTVLFLYGGEKLSEQGPGTRLLQANCAYIFVMALNGVTEAFTFAAMTKDQMDKFNRKLVIFSIVFLAAAYLFTRIFGSVGFFLANSLNMGLRIVQSSFLIRNVFGFCDINPFEFWQPKKQITAAFGLAFFLINLFSIFFSGNRLIHVSFGLVIFAVNCCAIYFREKELIQFFVKMYKTKSA